MNKWQVKGKHVLSNILNTIYKILKAVIMLYFLKKKKNNKTILLSKHTTRNIS